MSVYVCLCLSMSVCVFVYVFVCLRLCVCVCMCVCVRVCEEKWLNYHRAWAFIIITGSLALPTCLVTRFPGWVNYPFSTVVLKLDDDNLPENACARVTINFHSKRWDAGKQEAAQTGM